MRYSGGLDHVIGKVKLHCHCREWNYDTSVGHPLNLTNTGPQVPDKLRRGNIRDRSLQNPFSSTLLSESIMAKVHRGKVLLFRGMKLCLHVPRKGAEEDVRAHQKSSNIWLERILQ